MTTDRPVSTPTPAATQSRAPVSQPISPLRTEDFGQLMQRFNISGCGAEAFSIATWMFSRFPAESKQLLPLIRDEQLGCDGKKDNNATTHEWAAALVAAKKIKLETGQALATVTEPQAHDSIARIFSENKKGAQVCSL